MFLQVVSWLASAAILMSYAWFLRTGRGLPMHWANALGSGPLIYVEVRTGAWQVLPLTACFGALGWWGVLKP